MEYMLMPLRRYADFTGRSRRQEFWMWQLFKFLVSIAFMIVFTVLVGTSIFAMAGAGESGMGGGAVAAAGVGIVLYLVMLLFGLAIIVPDIAVVVRRLHDTNRTGWFILAPLAGLPIIVLAAVANSSALSVVGALVYLVGGIAVLVFMFLDGTPGPNNYGPDPKGRGEVAPAY